MTKVVQRPIKPGKGTISKEKIAVRDGKLRHYYPSNSISTTSGNFIGDISEAFRNNVAAALRKKK